MSDGIVRATGTTNGGTSSAPRAMSSRSPACFVSSPSGSSTCGDDRWCLCNANSIGPMSLTSEQIAMFSSSVGSSDTTTSTERIDDASHSRRMQSA